MRGLIKIMFGIFQGVFFLLKKLVLHRLFSKFLRCCFNVFAKMNICSVAGNTHNVFDIQTCCIRICCK